MTPSFPSRAKYSRDKRGFTLIELLAVIGVILVLAGVGFVGIRIGARGEGPNLQAAQALVSSLYTTAKAQAALTQYKTRLLISNDLSSPDAFMRELSIAVERPTASNPDVLEWALLAEPVLLPPNIYIVPEQKPTPNWDDEAVSRFSSSGSVSLNGKPAKPYHWLEFLPRGTLTSGSGAKIALSTGEGVDQTQPVFNNPNNVRGLTVSKYGLQVLVNSTDSF